MLELKAELDATKKEKEEIVDKNSDLQTLIEALKNNNGNNLPNYITVISLVPNQYNISTESNGKGTCYSFSELGESKIISLDNVQKIMGVSKYRQQAEKGYFYMLEDEVNDYFRLDPTSNTIDDIKAIVNLSSDDCVDRFVKLDEKLQKSLADKMALDMANGVKLDRNKINEIYDATNIDIIEMSKMLKKVMNK